MIRLFLVIAALCAPTGLSAACLDGGSAGLPSLVTFQSGETVQVIERSSDRIRYLSFDKDKRQVADLTSYLGIFTLGAEMNGQTNRFEWSTELPGSSELTPGVVFREEAVISHENKRASFITEAKVLGREVVEIDGCKFDVLRVDVMSWIDGREYGRAEKWLHLPSFITLKVVIRQGSSKTENQAVKLE